jgi:abhydrolase domain-containing protein 12
MSQELIVPGPSIINRVKTVFTVLGGVYVFAVGLLAVPYFQTQFVFSFS